MVSGLKTQHRDYRFATFLTCVGSWALDLYDEQEAFDKQEPLANTQQEEERCEKVSNTYHRKCGKGNVNDCWC